MKLGTLKDGRAIAAVGERWVPLASLGFPGTLIELAQSGSDGLERLERALETSQTEGEPLDPTQLGPPIPRPPKIICIGLNYRDHALEAGMSIPTQPVIFARFATTLIGPFDPVERDSGLTGELDYEVELAVVIGQGGKRIPFEAALGHVLGYSVCNDISARDLQMGKDTGGQWTRGKNLDGTCPIGPWIVTRDEVPDPQNLRLGCSLNGLTLQDSNTREMVFGVRALVHRLSHWLSLEVGDVIITGTPVGVGFARRPPVFLQPGDVTRAWVEGVGEIENRIVEADVRA